MSRHERDGLLFERAGDGDVVISMRTSCQRIPAWEWARIVASMSRAGNLDALDVAEALHDEPSRMTKATYGRIRLP